MQPAGTSKPQGDYRIEPMKLAGVEVAIDWAAREGWNPGLNDAQCFYAIDPDGFFAGMLAGRQVASGAAMNYDGKFSFAGLYIVEPDCRGNGYGLSLTKALLDHAGDRNVGIDGVEAMADRYAGLGFRAAHRTTRHNFTPTGVVGIPAEIVSLASVPFAELVAYDRRHFFAPRDRFLELWIDQPHAVGWACMDAGLLKGYGVLRKCRIGYKIGPLFAETTEIAQSLLAALSNHAVGERVSIDIPEPNEAANSLVTKYTMTPDFTCLRMYSRGDPGLPLQSIFGNTTFEAG